MKKLSVTTITSRFTEPFMTRGCIGTQVTFRRRRQKRKSPVKLRVVR